MEKREILREFLKHGIMLSPEEFEKINESNYKKILESYIKPSKKQEEENTEVSVKKTERKKKLSVIDVTKIYRKRYEILRDIILNKTQAISINKVASLASEICIVGVVKEITEKGFIIEDLTGRVEVIAETGTIEIDDVIGVKGFCKDNKIFPKEIIFPDIPLINKPSLIDIDILFNCQKRPADVIIGYDIEEGEKTAKLNRNVEWVNIKKDNDEITILVYKPKRYVDKNEAILYLRKRSLPFDLNEIDSIVIENVPQIFWIVSNNLNWKENYKGVVIISTEKSSCAIYNLATDKIIFENKN
jgi:hypothetical protein